jgi:hypothetical protein
MEKKLTQQEKVVNILKENGHVSRNACINSRLTIRLGAIIERLRNKQGMNISGKHVGSDFIYYLEQ